MTQLFAAHLSKKPSSSRLVSGRYDPEQELWIADNQLQGVYTPTQTFETTHIPTGIPTQTPCDFDTEPDRELDDDPDPDRDPGG